MLPDYPCHNCAKHFNTDIHKYLFFNSEVFDAMLQSLFFCEKYVKQAEPEYIFNELIDWISRIDNWAHSDMLTQHFAYLHEVRPDLVYPHLQEWNKSDNPWMRRQSVYNRHSIKLSRW